MKLNYAIVFVSDMPRAVAFYRDVLGLTLRFESPQWTEFTTGDATLALHLSKPALGAPAEAHTAGTCRPGLSVPDLDAFHTRVTGQKVTCVQPPKETFGARIAQYLDPDGLVISISEHK